MNRLKSAWRLRGIALLAGSFSLGCGARTELIVCENFGEIRPCETICGKGSETCIAGFWKECTAPKPNAVIDLVGTIRDFHASHPDFEDAIGDDRGIVEAQLGEDKKPVYAGKPTTPTTTGKGNFDMWYRDMEGVNQRAERSITLQKNADGEEGVYQYINENFFPIDGALFGNEGNDHNYHFTYEVSTSFRYVGGEAFTFSGDDDLWVFMNGRLALDLGGVHWEQSDTVMLDDKAIELGLEKGGVYELALFFAERHSTSSVFRIDTSIAEFDACPMPGE